MDESLTELKEKIVSPLKFSKLENEIDCIKNEKQKKRNYLNHLQQILWKHQLKFKENECFPNLTHDDIPGEFKENFESDDQKKILNSLKNHDEIDNSEIQACSEMLQNRITILEQMLTRQQNCINEIERKALHLSECNGQQCENNLLLTKFLNEMKIVGIRCLSDTALVNKNQWKYLFTNRRTLVADNGGGNISVCTCQTFNADSQIFLEKTHPENSFLPRASVENDELCKQIYIMKKKLDVVSECFIQGKKFKLLAESCFKVNQDIQRKLEVELQCFADVDGTNSLVLQTLKYFHEQCVQMEITLQEQEMILKNVTEDLRQIHNKEWAKNLQPYEQIEKLEASLLEKEYLLQQREIEQSEISIQMQALKNSLFMYKNQLDLAGDKITELEQQCHHAKEEVQRKNAEMMKLQEKYIQVNELLEVREEEVKTMQQLWNEFERNQLVENLKQQEHSVKKTDGNKLLLEENSLASFNDNMDDQSCELHSPIHLKDNVIEKINEEKHELELSLNDLTLKHQQLNELLKTKTQELNDLETQMEIFQKDAFKKDKFIHQLREEMNCLQNITNQLEDYHRGVRERDNKIFQLETDLDSELRLKEEKEMIVQNYHQRIKLQKVELEEKDKQLLQVQQILQEKENAIKSFQTMQTNLQTEMQDRENQCNSLQEELINMEATLQEMRDSKESLRLQNESIKKQLDWLMTEKDKAEKQEEVLQKKLLDASNELKLAEKLINTWRDKINQKNVEVKRLLAELERKEHFIIRQQGDIDKVIHCNDEQEMYIRTLEEQLKQLQMEISEKNTSTSIFSFLPDFNNDNASTSPMPEMLKGELNALQAVLENKNELIVNLQECVESKNGHIQFLHTLYITLQNELQNKDKKISFLSDQIVSSESEIKELEAVKLNLEKRIKLLNQENEEKSIQIRSFEISMENFQRELEEKRVRAQNLRSQMHTIQVKYQKTAKERDEKKFSESNLVTQVANLHHRIQNILKEHSEKDAKFDLLQDRINELENDTEVSRKINDKKEHKIQVLTCQLGTIKIELEDREKVIGNLQSEMNLFRESEQEKNNIIEQQKLQAKRNQCRLDNFNAIIQHLQTEITVLKEAFNSHCKSEKNDKEESENLKSQIHVLVSEMEMWQYKLQAAQIEWEEKENVYQILTSQVENLQNRLEEKKQTCKVLEGEISSEEGKKTQDFQRHCLYMEIKILQEEMDSKQKALQEAVENLNVTDKQKKRIEDEVNTLLTEMEKIQEQYDAIINDQNASTSSI